VLFVEGQPFGRGASPIAGIPPGGLSRTRSDMVLFASLIGALLVGAGFGVVGFAYIVYLDYFLEPNPDDVGAIVDSLRFTAVGYGLLSAGCPVLFVSLAGPRGHRSRLTIVGALASSLGFLTLAANAAREVSFYYQDVFLYEVEGLFRTYAMAFLLVGVGFVLGFFGIGLRLWRHDSFLGPSVGPSFAGPGAVLPRPLFVPPPDPVAAAPPPVVGPTALPWSPGMPTRCGNCLGTSLEYQADGSARCRDCQSFSRPVWS